MITVFSYMEQKVLKSRYLQSCSIMFFIILFQAAMEILLKEHHSKIVKMWLVVWQYQILILKDIIVHCKHFLISHLMLLEKLSNLSPRRKNLGKASFYSILTLYTNFINPIKTILILVKHERFKVYSCWSVLFARMKISLSLRIFQTIPNICFSNLDFYYYYYLII